MNYSLSHLGPDAVERLSQSLGDSAGVDEFLEHLRVFLSGEGSSAAEKDLAFSVAAELNAAGIIDKIPLEKLQGVLSKSDAEKVKFFVKGLPRRHRANVERDKNTADDHVGSVVVKAISTTARRRGGMNDPIGDMLTRIRNAQMRGKSTVSTPASKLRGWVLDVLREEGYIHGYDATESDSGHSSFTINLKYFEGAPVIRELKRVSKPGRRVYLGVKEIPSVRQGLGVAVVRNSDGVSIVRTDQGEIISTYDLAATEF